MSTTIWERIEAARERWNVLEHPFYQRWSAGELTADELARYSGQYGHAVGAISTLSAAIADAAPERPELRSHAREEAAHVELWEGFVSAAGGDATDAPTPETAACVEAWTAPAELGELLARLYAVESGQPAISKTKREGLLARYGYEEGPGVAYFKIHETRDVEHAAEARELIESIAAEADADRLVAAAEDTFKANWTLLDGV